MKQIALWEAEIWPFQSNLKDLETSKQGGVFLTEYFTSESDNSIKLLPKIVVFSSDCLKLSPCLLGESVIFCW